MPAYFDQKFKDYIKKQVENRKNIKKIIIK